MTTHANRRDFMGKVAAMVALPALPASATPLRVQLQPNVNNFIQKYNLPKHFVFSQVHD